MTRVWTGGRSFEDAQSLAVDELGVTASTSSIDLRLCRKQIGTDLRDPEA